MKIFREKVFFILMEMEKLSGFLQKGFMNHLENWAGYYYNYTTVNGFKIPSDVKVVWNLEEGYYAYTKFHVLQMDYNNSEKYN